MAKSQSKNSREKSTPPQAGENQPPAKVLQGAAAGQSFEDFTNQQVARYNVTDAKIAELKAKYTGLVVTDEETYKKAKEAKRELVPLRTGVEAVRKDLKAVALEYGRKIDAEAKRITGELETIEEPIDKEIKAWDEKAEIERQRVENEKIERAKSHIQNWVDKGVLYNVQTEKYYYFDHENRAILDLTLAEIKELSDAEIDFITENIEACFNIAQERKAEEDRLRKEEEDRREEQRKENERVAEQNRQAAEKLAQEKKEIEDALFETRSAKLIAAGFFAGSETAADTLIFRNPSGTVYVVREEIVGVNKDIWLQTEEQIFKKVDALKQKEEDRIAEQMRIDAAEQEEKEKQKREADRLENLWNLRKAVLEAAGFTLVDGCYCAGDLYAVDQEGVLKISDEDFNEMIAFGKAEIARLAQVAADKKLADEKAEQQRLIDQGTDKEKLTAFCAELGKLIVPQVKTKWANQVADGLREMLHKANGWATEQISKKK